MSDRRRAAIRVTLETLYFSGIHLIARQFLGGAGAILTLHRVRPPRPEAFQPNRSLEVTPEFLEEVVTTLRAADVDLVSMDEVHRRVIAGDGTRRFVAMTLDDGYRDTMEFAWPVLKRHGVPFTLYVASDFPEGRGDLWWVVLEHVIARNTAVTVTLDGAPLTFDCSTSEAKQPAFDAIYVHLRAARTETDLRAVTRALAFTHHVDVHALCREACMDWDDISTLAADPLVTIGAHTVTHPILSKLTPDVARGEMLTGVRDIAAQTGKTPVHFAYPVGTPDAAGPREFEIAAAAGFKTAVTTRPGVLFNDHAKHLTALPRITVNGDFQRFRYLDVLLSGAPTALMNRFRRVDAA